MHGRNNMTFFFVLLLHQLFAASFVFGANYGIGDIVAFKATLGTWKKRRVGWRSFKKDDPSKLTPLLTFDIPNGNNKDCALIRSGGAWKCVDNPEPHHCKGKGLALVMKKSGKGKFQVYRRVLTRPTKNVIMTFCAGNNVEMSKKLLKPTYFWSLDSDDPAALKIKSGQLASTTNNLASEFISAFAAGQYSIIKRQWSDKAKAEVYKQIRLVNIPAASGIMGEREQVVERTHLWTIPVRVFPEGQVSSIFDYFVVDYDDTGGQDGMSYWSEPHFEEMSLKLLEVTRDRIALNCPYIAHSGSPQPASIKEQMYVHYSPTAETYLAVKRPGHVRVAKKGLIAFVSSVDNNLPSTVDQQTQGFSPGDRFVEFPVGDEAPTCRHPFE